MTASVSRMIRAATVGIFQSPQTWFPKTLDVQKSVHTDIVFQKHGLHCMLIAHKDAGTRPAIDSLVSQHRLQFPDIVCHTEDFKRWTENFVIQCWQIRNHIWFHIFRRLERSTGSHHAVHGSFLFSVCYCGHVTKRSFLFKLTKLSFCLPIES